MIVSMINGLYNDDEVELNNGTYHIPCTYNVLLVSVDPTLVRDMCPSTNDKLATLAMEKALGTSGCRLATSLTSWPLARKGVEK